VASSTSRRAGAPRSRRTSTTRAPSTRRFAVTCPSTSPRASSSRSYAALRRSAASAQGAAFAFWSAHEGAIYDVARHIWRPVFRRGEGGGANDASDEDDINPVAAAAMEDGGGGSESASTPTPTPMPMPTARGRGGRRVWRRTAQELEAPALPATSALMLTDAAEDRLVVAVENLAPAIAPPPPL
jgi:hypothetical protein